MGASNDDAPHLEWDARLALRNLAGYGSPLVDFLRNLRNRSILGEN